MAPEVRFTPYGIPYVVEFANVAFRKRSKSASVSSFLAPSVNPSKSTTTVNHAPTTLHSTSSTTLVDPPRTESEGHGLFIRFASPQVYPYQRLSETRLAQLKRRIARAVSAAGMDTAPAPEIKDPMRRISHGHIHSSEFRYNARSLTVPNSLYRGTYGQVMSALKEAGLMTTPCGQSGFSDAQRLGALFVLHHTEFGTVELTKLTLWA